MKHRKKGRTLGRDREQRRALLASLVSSLFIHERIETTLAKAKELRPFAEKMITKGKIKSAARIRLARKIISKKPTQKLFNVIAPSFLKRKGGYLRIIKKSQRKSDGAPMALIELVKVKEEKEEPAKLEKKIDSKEAKAK